MTDTSITAYADALLAIAAAEGDPERVRDELSALGRAVASDETLRSTLADVRLPVERRAQIIEDVLDSASPATVGIASMLVVTGRAAELPEIAEEVVRRAAASVGATLADVRSAVPLTDDQLSRLTVALTEKLGREVVVRNVVDPTVIGGVVTQIGDQVIDGTIRSRLNQLRDQF